MLLPVATLLLLISYAAALDVCKYTPAQRKAYAKPIALKTDINNDGTITQVEILVYLADQGQMKYPPFVNRGLVLDLGISDIKQLVKHFAGTKVKFSEADFVKVVTSVAASLASFAKIQFQYFDVNTDSVLDVDEVFNLLSTVTTNADYNKNGLSVDELVNYLELVVAHGCAANGR